ncbi:MAG: hypothetical protein COA42_18135 [Alteromonadaceae bacterium]|nr:MAG: hypothetical protein COA42_18135 [Alteromonadaceae bacterium]
MLKTSRLAIAATLFALASSANAGFYLGAKVGSVDVDIDVDPNIDADSDIGYNLNVGYQFTKYFGIEAAYVDLGEHDYNQAITSSFSVEGNVAVRGMDVSAIATLPLSEQFSLYGRVGYYLWEADINFRTIGSIPGLSSLSSSTNDDGGDISFGVGASYAVSEKVDLQLGFTRYAADDIDIDADLIGLGVKFSF